MYFETNLFQTLHCTKYNTFMELAYIYTLQEAHITARNN